jgi:TonB-dependent Receptor Plug Domain
MRSYLLIVISFFLLQKESFSQTSNSELNIALSKMKSARKNRPVENIYIHFDKPFYVTGDTIYFKTYVTMSEWHKPTPLSEVVHVDLFGPQNTLLFTIRLKLKGGTAFGDFELPDSIPAGMYRVRAYTQWMLNERNVSFFNQFIPVGSVKHLSQAATIPINNIRSGKPDIQFFPEGGELLTGVETKVAFKAIANNGMGTGVKGIVVDNNGKEITRFQSVHLGMGFFYLKPEEGNSYSAKLSFSDGSNSSVELPKANRNGIVLSADNESPETILINVLSSPAYFATHKNEDIILLVNSGGTTLMSESKLDSEQIEIAIDKKQFVTGIVRATLFSSRAEPLSERLLFVKKQDQMHLEVKSVKSQYNKREKIEISLHAEHYTKKPAAGDFSVSVVNEDFIKVDENTESTILSNFLLSSELSGWVEQPNYYFVHTGDEVAVKLDILMLTQGYRHFLWKQILTDSLPPLKYKAERFLQLQGMVRSSTGKPVTNETVTLIDSSGQGPKLTETTDSAGRFVFKDLDFSNMVRFTISASKTSSRILFTNDFLHVANADDTAASSSYADSNMSIYLKLEAIDQEFKSSKNVKLLNEVTIARKKSADSYYTESLAGAGHADQVFNGNELKGGGNLTDQLMGRLHGIVFFKGTPFLSINVSGDGNDKPTPMMVVVDGIQLNPPKVDEINSNEIETIEVLRSGNASMYGMNGSGGVLVITTKRPKDVEVVNTEDPNTLQVSVAGFYIAKEFYSPAYSLKDSTNLGQDRRITVFWKPDLVTDENGNASFNFYNGDLKGTYRVLVQGINGQGDIGRQVYRYTVK